jgi:hypothetical protein
MHACRGRQTHFSAIFAASFVIFDPAHCLEIFAKRTKEQRAGISPGSYQQSDILEFTKPS